ncbi:hypothetical protein [Streptomyces mirabilis]|uniref:hypothetical protein n=1 Tax=Streptomyces mirabilis TaxID=68239 RepID=UPI0036B75AD7
MLEHSSWSIEPADRPPVSRRVTPELVFRRQLGDLVLKQRGEFGGQGGLGGSRLDRVQAGLATMSNPA